MGFWWTQLRCSQPQGAFSSRLLHTVRRAWPIPASPQWITCSVASDSLGVRVMGQPCLAFFPMCWRISSACFTATSGLGPSKPSWTWPICMGSPMWREKIRSDRNWQCKNPPHLEMIYLLKMVFSQCEVEFNEGTKLGIHWSKHFRGPGNLWHPHFMPITSQVKQATLPSTLKSSFYTSYTQLRVSWNRDTPNPKPLDHF